MFKENPLPSHFNFYLLFLFVIEFWHYLCVMRVDVLPIIGGSNGHVTTFKYFFFKLLGIKYKKIIGFYKVSTLNFLDNSIIPKLFFGVCSTFNK